MLWFIINVTCRFVSLSPYRMNSGQERWCCSAGRPLVSRWGHHCHGKWEQNAVVTFRARGHSDEETVLPNVTRRTYLTASQTERLGFELHCGDNPDAHQQTSVWRKHDYAREHTCSVKYLAESFCRKVDGTGAHHVN